MQTQLETSKKKLRDIEARARAGLEESRKRLEALERELETSAQPHSLSRSLSQLAPTMSSSSSASSLASLSALSLSARLSSSTGSGSGSGSGSASSSSPPSVLSPSFGSTSSFAGSQFSNYS
eukprot:TRINITY_DN3658_c0_g1_i15.p2 TRINITY_DN3658_c0_g1~~TRINITY_DN3658_c0_g1_i15.p2  ORF type:complete len:122 (-),score=36.40 TRINITY_DN3658_c0_g1_i15:410-775(-)